MLSIAGAAAGEDVGTDARADAPIEIDQRGIDAAGDGLARGGNDAAKVAQERRAAGFGESGRLFGSKFWLSVLNDLKTRGVEDILIACVDGLKGFPQAIEAAYPQTTVQLCIVHMVRASLRFVSWKDAKAVVADLKMIYRAVSRENAEQQLEVFAAKWDAKYHSISQLWRRPGRHSQSHLHDQRGGVSEHDSAQGDQDPRLLPQ